MQTLKKSSKKLKDFVQKFSCKKNKCRKKFDKFHTKISYKKFHTKNFIQKILTKSFIQKILHKNVTKNSCKKFHTKITYKKIHTKNKKINVEKNCHRKLKKMF